MVAGNEKEFGRREVGGHGERRREEGGEREIKGKKGRWRVEKAKEAAGRFCFFS